MKNNEVTSSRIVRLSGRHDFGIPLPFFRFKDNTLKFFLSSKQIEFNRAQFREHGTKIWKDWPVSSLLHEDYLDLADKIEKVESVLDENFEAGLFWYYFGNRTGEGLKGRSIDILVEGADATGEWLHEQGVSQAMLGGFPQFRELFVHPVCVDEEGERISKKTHSQSADSLVYGSLKLNNEVQYGMGAEVLRLWAASVTSDTPQSNTIVCLETFIGRQDPNQLRPEERGA